MADRDYEMSSTAEMMVNDFDDERTLDEEEALEGSEDSHNELSNLQKEGDMPLKDLLAMYGYGDPSTENSNSSDRILLPSGSADPEADANYSDKGDNDADDDDDDDETETASNEPDLKQFYTEMLVKGKSSSALSGGTSSKSNNSGGTRSRGRRRDVDDEDDDDDEEVDDCAMLDGRSGNSGSAVSVSGTASGNNCSNMTNMGSSATDGVSSAVEADSNEDGVISGSLGSGTSRLLRSVSRPQSEEEEDDCDYSPEEEEWKKTIMVGNDYQAVIPEGLCRYDDALPYENEDKMLWDPNHMEEYKTEEFLIRAQLHGSKSGALPAGSHVRDDEQALYLLLQCGYNLEEALRRRRMNVVPSTETVSLWSEEECHNFESGLRAYGKDFHLIQKNKVRTRSVGELVQFYYLWKKTERHDIFTYKARMEKKKYALHPGITDYMDRFLEEQEGVRDRSSSPNVHYLLYDAKRQRTNTNTANNDDSKSEGWDGNISDLMIETQPSLPPPPPPVSSTGVSSTGVSSTSTVNNSNVSSTTQCSSTTRHAECASLDNGCGNPLNWPSTGSKSTITPSSTSSSSSSVSTTVTVNSATVSSSTATSTVANTSAVSSSTTTGTASGNNLYSQRVSSSRSSDSRDSSSPENILPHLPP